MTSQNVKIKNNYRQFYDDFVKVINSRFETLFDDYSPDSLYDPCSYIMQIGGKRLRPFLVTASAKVCGSEPENVYNAAMAVELLHNFTLVHDDIMDNALTRRGKETIHKKYGLNAAILAGDNLIAFAYKTLLKDCHSDPIKALGIFTQGIIEVCEGQSMDTDFEQKDEVSIEEYKKMIEQKTAALLEVCCNLGATLANADMAKIEALSLYGLNLGMAFQIQDDLLDIMSDEKEFGKRTGGDLIEGKKTFLFLKALEKAKGKDKDMLEDVIRRKGISSNEVAAYKNIYNRLDVISDARTEIENYTNKALEAIAPLDNSEILKWLADVLLKRSK